MAREGLRKAFAERGAYVALTAGRLTRQIAPWL